MLGNCATKTVKLKTNINDLMMDITQTCKHLCEEVMGALQVNNSFLCFVMPPVI